MSKEVSFLDTKSYTKLKGMVGKAVDLTHSGTMTPERLKDFSLKGLGWTLLFGTERVSHEIMDTLFDLAEERHVMDQMKAMQEGAVLNKIEGCESEERTVLHTAMRDIFDQPNQADEAKKATALAQTELDKLKSFMENVDKEGTFTDFVQIGIGGSDLGPRAVYLALKALGRKDRRVHFVSNVDPDDAACIFQDLDLKKTLVVVVSKSGGTLETLTNETLARSYFEKAGMNSKDHFLAVTGEGSPMDNPERYLQSFYLWDFIGGRYSASCMVGAVMLAFGIGYDKFMEFLRGMHEMDLHALNASPKENLPLRCALLGIWNRNFLGCPTVAILPYSQALIRFTAHLQQLDMESNGKHIDKKGNELKHESGPVIWGEPGTNGQHSFYQLIHQGTNVIPCEFVGFSKGQYGKDLNVKGTLSQEKLLSNLFAQSLALATGQKSENPNQGFHGNRPNRVLLGKTLDAYHMGSLLSLYEHKVAFQGFVWGINSFDQEGVQLGKVLANKFLDIFTERNSGGKEDPKAFPMGSAFLDALDGVK